ncbi:hypothetical protein GCM10023203_36050 [Actinomycetospora straminea]|uniref:Uncharacterized protein n=1 Tax=Actinomycetospora straminea TaxID=663607 RepID=A0ABP9EKB6_9PSEU
MGSCLPGALEEPGDGESALVAADVKSDRRPDQGVDVSTEGTDVHAARHGCCPSCGMSAARSVAAPSW